MAEASAEDPGGPGGSGGTDEEPYSGLFGAIPYAFGASRSWLFKLYVVCGGLVALAATVLMALALVVLVSRTATVGGGSLTLSRAFFVVVGLFVVGPLLAPILLVARRHRRQGSRRQYDAGLALAGYVFLGSLYAGLVISEPSGQQEAVSGMLAPIIEFLYALPQIAGVVPPVLAAACIALTHWLTN